MVSNHKQDNPHEAICNCTTDEYVNIVLEISGMVHNANFIVTNSFPPYIAECNPPFDACKQECK